MMLCTPSLFGVEIVLCKRNLPTATFSFSAGGRASNHAAFLKAETSCLRSFRACLDILSTQSLAWIPTALISRFFEEIRHFMVKS
jgi:hypothetical protein